MQLTLLWIAHTSFSLALAGAGLAPHARGNRSRRATLAAFLGIIPCLLFNAYLAGSALYARTATPHLNVPWAFAVSAFVAHIAGAMTLLQRAQRGADVLGWSVQRFVTTAVVAAGFEVTLLRIGAAEARNELLHLQVEAGRTAFALTARPTTDASNAAPIYERIAKHWDDGAEQLDFGEFGGALANRERLDTAAPGLRARLARCSTELAEVRAASLLPECRFGATDDQLGSVPPVLGMVNLTQALCAEARVHLADGRCELAVADVAAALRVAQQLARTPSLITLLGATQLREVSLQTLGHVLADEHVTVRELDDLALALGHDFAPLVPDALRMEEAWGITMLASLADSDAAVEVFDGSSALGWTALTLYSAFSLSTDVHGYREALHELAELSRRPLAELLAAAREERAGRRDELVRSRGLLATLAVPRTVGRIVFVHESDARVALARVALAATRERLATGTYPRTLDAWAGDATDVRIESNGSTLRLVREAAVAFDQELEYSLPPSVSQ